MIRVRYGYPGGSQVKTIVANHFPDNTLLLKFDKKKMKLHLLFGIMKMMKNYLL